MSKKTIVEALESAFEPIRIEGVRRSKDFAKAIREEERAEKAERAEKWTLKDAVFEVVEEAVQHVSGGGQLSFAVRKLFYAVRPRIAEYTDKELKYDNFRNTLVIEYQRAHGEIPGLYFEPRGTMYEPHTGNTVLLGTREVEDYEFPAYLYNKLAYVEKTGMWPTLQDARLAERYDMAVATGSGYATTAARKLLEKAEKGEDYQIFVLHDADPDGYNIGRTVQAETWRMPDHHIQVIDLGLTIAEAYEMDLPFEEFTRKKALPAKVEKDLTEQERECFVGDYLGKDGKGKDTYRCWRVELDAMTAPQTIEYIERKMRASGARGKVIPPDDYLLSAAEDAYKTQIDARVDREIHRLINVPEIRKLVADNLRDSMELPEARKWIEEGFEDDVSQQWQKPVQNELSDRLAERSDRITGLVRERINEDPE